MTAAAVPSFSSLRTTKSRIGLVVLGAVGSGLALGLVLVLAVFVGGPEHEITGAALFALGVGFVLLGIGSRRFTDQPQDWALRPGLAVAVGGVALFATAPGNRVLDLSGWVWPVLLLVLVGRSFRGAHRSLKNWSRRVVLYPALVVLSLVAVGGAFETVTQATTSNPPLGGSTYLVDGHRLYLHCTGAGAPTVVLFNGLGERTPSWAWVQHDVSPATRICAYDRAGEGWSGGKVSAQRLASDLHGLLRAARIPGPYVLAGHSVGGTYALVYAVHYPDEVAGLALIDSSTPYQFDLPDYPGTYAMLRRLYSVMPAFARTGILRVVPGFGGLPPRARNAASAFASSPRELRADRVEVAALPHMFDEAKAVTTLGAKPLAIVTAPRGAQRGWLEAQRQLAALSTSGVQRIVAGATHAELLEDTRYATITSRAITQVVRQARSGRR